MPSWDILLLLLVINFAPSADKFLEVDLLLVTALLFTLVFNISLLVFEAILLPPMTLLSLDAEDFLLSFDSALLSLEEDFASLGFTAGLDPLVTTLPFFTTGSS